MNFRKLCFPILLFTTVVTVSSARAQPCSLSTLKGYYAMQGQGTVVQYPDMPTPFPMAEVARDYFDGAGNIFGHFTANGDGVVVTGNLKGTYTVNPDCTGTIALPGVDQFFVVVGNGGLRLVQTDSWIVLTRTMEKMPEWDSCSLSTLKGSYSVQGEGTVVAQVPGWPAPPIPLAEEANYSLDGAGNVSGSFTANVDGTVVTGTINGTYAVKPNCTGTITSSGGGLPFNQWFVVRRDGSLRLVQTDSWITITRTMEKMPD